MKQVSNYAGSAIAGAMSPKAAPSFVTRVRDALPALHPSERRLAEAVLNFPGELASYSATELARLANVSNATVTRFVRKLGYASFEEARQHVRADRQTGAALLRVVASAPAGGDLVAAHVAQGRANLEQTFVAIPQAEIDGLATAMLQARRVWVVGSRTSHAFAQYLAWQILQVIPAVTVIPGAGETLAETIAAMTEDDVVIVFGLRRRLLRMPVILEQIGRSGARVAQITDLDIADEERATWRFRCQTAAPGPLFNHVSVLALCHLVATRTIELAGRDGRRRLTAIESLHEKLDEL
jgi:DNA-binding MurR/RpiR family transcriptional regulator